MSECLKSKLVPYTQQLWDLSGCNIVVFLCWESRAAKSNTFSLFCFPNLQFLISFWKQITCTDFSLLANNFYWLFFVQSKIWLDQRNCKLWLNDSVVLHCFNCIAFIIVKIIACWKSLKIIRVVNDYALISNFSQYSFWTVIIFYLNKRQCLKVHVFKLDYNSYSQLDFWNKIEKTGFILLIWTLIWNCTASQIAVSLQH